METSLVVLNPENKSKYILTRLTKENSSKYIGHDIIFRTGTPRIHTVRKIMGVTNNTVKVEMPELKNALQISENGGRLINVLNPEFQYIIYKKEQNNYKHEDAEIKEMGEKINRPSIKEQILNLCTNKLTLKEFNELKKLLDRLAQTFN